MKILDIQSWRRRKSRRRKPRRKRSCVAKTRRLWTLATCMKIMKWLKYEAMILNQCKLCDKQRKAEEVLREYIHLYVKKLSIQTISNIQKKCRRKCEAMPSWKCLNLERKVKKWKSREEKYKLVVKWWRKSFENLTEEARGRTYKYVKWPSALRWTQ